MSNGTTTTTSQPAQMMPGLTNVGIALGTVNVVLTVLVFGSLFVLSVIMFIGRLMPTKNSAKTKSARSNSSSTASAALEHQSSKRSDAVASSSAAAAGNAKHNRQQSRSAPPRKSIRMAKFSAIHVLCLITCFYAAYNLYVGAMGAWDVFTASRSLGMILQPLSNLAGTFVNFCMATAFLWIWIDASAAVDFIVAASVKRGAETGTDEQKNRAKQKASNIKLALYRMRIVLKVICVASLIPAGVALGMLVAALSQLRPGYLPDFSKGLAISGIILIVLPLVSYSIIVCIVGALIIVAMRHSTSILASTQTSKSIQERIAKQRATQRKLLVGIVLFLIHAVILLVGSIVATGVNMVNTGITAGMNPVNFFLIDVLGTRILPMGLAIADVVLLFWPWKLPSWLFCVCHNSATGKYLANPIQIGAVGGGTTSDGDTTDISTSTTEIKNVYDVVAMSPGCQQIKDETVDIEDVKIAVDAVEHQDSPTMPSSAVATPIDQSTVSLV